MIFCPFCNNQLYEINHGKTQNHTSMYKCISVNCDIKPNVNKYNFTYGSDGLSYIFFYKNIHFILRFYADELLISKNNRSPEEKYKLSECIDPSLKNLRESLDLFLTFI